MRRFAVLACAVGVLFTTAHADEWDTFYESSGHLRTPSYEETIEFCKKLDEASPWIHYTVFGTSPQGRDLPLLVVNRSGEFNSEIVREGDNVVFLIQAGIHSGEIDGKDAGLMLLRDIVIRKALPAELLEHVTILFIPIFNVDGHERSGPYSRANQNGPVEMGWRTTANNLNLNRDYLKVDAPEMRAWIRLYVEWLPEFFADCHVTDGADYQYVVTHAVDIYGNMDPGLTAWARDDYLAPLTRSLFEGGFPTMRYNWYRDEHDPRSGVVSWASPPRFSIGYTVIQNRPGILIETHMQKDYRTRVEGTYQLLLATLETLNEDHDKLERLCREADARVASSAYRAEPVALDYDVSPDSVMIDFLGFEYEIVKSDVTGGDWFRYSDRPTTMRIPFFDKLVVTESALLPEAYVIPPQFWQVMARLELHGVEFHRLEQPQTLDVESYLFRDVTWAEIPFEGRHELTFEMDLTRETRFYPEGSVVIDMNQRAARVAVHILEPGAPDSYVRWGFFDTIFEQKEYIESYVIEEMAREMLAGDPALREEFEAKKHSDPQFAGDPKQIRDWFYRRTPYWDAQMNLYPIGRVMDRTELEGILP